jgi:multiple sugar transport system substrate-binding protein
MSLDRRLLTSLGIAMLFILLAACAAPAPAAQTPAEQSASGETATTSPTPIVTWYYYDQNNTDPQANERVGNFYLAETIPIFNEQFAGQYEWINVPRDYNLVLDLVAAVQSNGEIPDVMRIGASDLPTFIVNNTVQDLTEFVTTAPWYEQLDPKAVEACTGPDGKIYCVPVSESPYVVFYWSDFFPDGFPKTPEELLAAAEALKSEGRYALTYWGSTAFDGEAAGRYFFQVLSSFGGGYDDGQGNLQLNRPENIAAIEFMRTIVQNGYSPEAVFVGSFEEEASFKTAEAAAFPTGHYVAYLYLNPLTAPDGTEYATATQQDMEDAVADGAIGIAPFVAPEGLAPGCHNDVFGFVIPNGAKNLEGAKTYINWILDPANGVDWVLSAGGGVPTSTAMREDEAFQTPIFQQGLAAAEASSCRPWYGSLLNIPEAKKIISTTIFDLIKGNPDADIAAALTAADEQYNSNR